MANCGITRIDPIGGLLQYVQQVKPYHTKVLEAIVKYTHNDLVSVYIPEKVTITTTIYTPECLQTFDCVGSYGVVYNSGRQNAPPMLPLRFRLFGFSQGNRFPSGPSDGQYFYNLVTQKLFQYTNASASWNEIITNYSVQLPTYSVISFTAPPSPINGEYWYDLTTGLLKQWNRSASRWFNVPFPMRQFGPNYNVISGTFQFNIGTIAPVGPVLNDFWFDPSVGIVGTLYQWDGTTWQVIPFPINDGFLDGWINYTPGIPPYERLVTPTPVNIVDINTHKYQLIAEGDITQRPYNYRAGLQINLRNSDPRNNRVYNIYSIQYDTLTDTSIIQLIQPIRVAKPPTQQYAGYIEPSVKGYSEANYCKPVTQDTLDVHAYIVESLTFKWGPEEGEVIRFKDEVIIGMEEQGVAAVPTNDGQTILPQSADGPAADFSGADENVNTVSVFYKQSFRSP